MLTTTVALVSVPAAFGAVDGDPIASQTFSFKLSGKFKKQLKKSGVKMKPKALKLTAGDIDPTTGAGDLKFANITFKKGKEKVQFKSLKGSMPGKIKSTTGAIFKLTAPTAARNGFGADLTGTKVKFLKSAAKKITKGLDLDKKLKPATAGSFNLAYQPKTVKIVSGTAAVTGILTPGSVISKLGAHCMNVPAPTAPATQTGLTITFPIAGGTISPAGTDGVVQQQGGVRTTNSTVGGCATSPAGSVLQENYAVSLALQNIQAHAVIEKGRALCGGAATDTCPPFTGDKGTAITQLADPAGSTVSANATNHTVTVNGATIRLADASALTLNGVFPRVSGTANDDFKAGDPFGSSNLTVTVR